MQVKNPLFLFLIGALCFGISQSAAAETPQQVCQSRKNIEVGRYINCRHKAKFIHRIDNESPSSRTCAIRFAQEWSRIVAKATSAGAICFDAPLESRDFDSYIRNRTNATFTLLGSHTHPRVLAQQVCRRIKSSAAGQYAACSLNAEAARARGASAERFNALVRRCKRTFSKSWQDIALDTQKRGTRCLDRTLSRDSYRLLIDDYTSRIAATLAGRDELTSVTIILTGSPLTLVAGGTAKSITVTNSSSRATLTDIKSNFDGTLLAGKITESSNTCKTLAPLASCALTFTPGNVAVALTDFQIQGSDTLAAVGSIIIEEQDIRPTPTTTPPATATPAASLSPTPTESPAPTPTFTTTPTASPTVTPTASPTLTPTATFTPTVTPTPTAANPVISVNPTTLIISENSTGAVTITNDAGSSVAADNIVATIPGGSNLSVQSSTCSSTLGIAASCTITFASATQEGPTTVFIAGDNTNTVNLSIVVTSQPLISITGPAQQSRVVATDGITALDLEITNDSDSIFNANNITITDNTGCPNLTVDSSNCTSVAPGGSCQLALTTTTPYAPCTITVSGSNTGNSPQTLIAFSHLGGLVFAESAGSGQVIIDEGSGFNGRWTNTSSNIVGAISLDDGAANTDAIISDGACTGSPANCAAKLCRDISVDWYLPSRNELSTVHDALCSNNAIPCNFGGFSSALYKSSTQFDTNSARVLQFPSGISGLNDPTSNLQPVRCVRSF